VGGIRRGSFVDFLTNEELMASQDPGKHWVGERGMRRRTGRVRTPGLENPAYRLPDGHGYVLRPTIRVMIATD